MKKAGRIIAAIVCVCTLFTTAYAAEATKKTYTLTLDEAVNMALEDNSEIEALEIALKSTKISLDDAIRTKYKYRNYNTVTANDYGMIYMKKGYYVDAFKTEERIKTKQIEQTKENITYETISNYFGYKLSNALCDVTQNAYELAEENLDNVTKRYELGMVAKIDLDNAALSVESVKNSLDQCKRNADLAKEKLKITLQIDDEDCDLILTDEITCDEFNAQIEEDIEKAKENRYDIMALRENYELLKEYFEYSKGLTEDSAQYQDAYSNYITAKNNYDVSQKQILLGVRSCYYNVINASDGLTTAEKSVELEKQKYEINKVKYENGIITNSDLTKSLNDYLNAGLSLENAKLNYKLAVEKYNAEIRIGIN